MKKYFLIILICINVSFLYSASLSISHFDVAYQEIKLMLEEKQTLSYKKAVFLTENAYLDGKLDENWFNEQVDIIVSQCKIMIKEKGLQKQKTAAQWAIFNYMCKENTYNQHRTYSYDFESLPKNANPERQMVSHLLKTGKGNCHSLPLLFMILSQELNAESYLALAPMHFFVKHKDENGEWWNLELTSGSFSRTSFIIESFNISDKQIESGYYMKPLSTKETLATILKDLFHYYDKKTGIYYDDFVRKIAETGLEYHKISSFVAVKIDVMKYKLDKDMAKLSLNDYNKIEPYPELMAQKKAINLLVSQLKSYGYTKLSHEWYEKKVMEALNLKDDTAKK